MAPLRRGFFAEGLIETSLIITRGQAISSGGKFFSDRVFLTA
jgi:hypothetical protein